ncbi:tetratricopeptide repeat protein [Lunatibacter salilacus]|uniref:tetratricopeptide repeat protein n=1 Tax=Lunatibacter salilacus TaxID=2483804 RepID=UPI00131B4F89|nr:tetratricopeptide repeat protein [Lunatibacter salilacus]
MKMTRQIKLILILLVFSVQGCEQLDSETERDIEKAVEYFNSEEYEKALTYVEKLIEKDSTNHISWALKGRALFNIGKEEQGIRAINKAIDINPAYRKAYGFRAVMYSLTGKYEMSQILSDIDVALSEDSYNSELIKIKANYLQISGQFEKAIDEYDKLLNIEPNNYDIIVLRASANRKLGNLDLALKEFNQAIEIDPAKSFAYEERATFFVEQQQFEKAIADYNKSIETISENKNFQVLKAYSLNNRGFAYFKFGENGKALTDISHSLKLLSTNSYAYKNRAMVYLKNGEKDKGCADLEKANDLGYTEQYGDEVEKLIDENCR